MIRINNNVMFVFFTALGILLLYLLAPILAPFLFGALIAYLANPLVKRLENRKVPHLLSVIIVFILIFGTLLLLIVLLVPLIQRQILILIDLIPQIVTWAQDTALPWLKEFINIETLKANLSASLTRAGWVLEKVVQSGYTIVGWTLTIILIPVVTFYMLRDWDKLCHSLLFLMPKKMRPTIVTLANQFDEVLGAFFRGQLLVMLGLSLIYGIGLTLIGLNVGLMIGLIGGVLSLVPYLGSLFVVVAASIAALVQFGNVHALIWVLGVFLIGQAIEGYILTPYLVGERIGLHPVVVIFAVLAGGALFGFFGVLLALPVAALLKVLIRFMQKQSAVQVM